MKTEALFEAETDITIPFHDVDLMAVAWHGHYVKYFEIARGVLFDKFDYNYAQMRDSGYAWPVIDMRIRYPASALYQQTVVVLARLTEWENRVKVDYELRDKATGKRLTRGYTVQVAVDMESGEMCYESPPILFEKLGIAAP